MTLDLKPNMILRGPIFSGPILSPRQLATLEITPEQEPFDGDAVKFRLGVEAIRLDDDFTSF